MPTSPAKKKDGAGQAGAQVRAYLAVLPPDARKALQKIREAIRSAAPKAEEAFSYGIPAVKLGGSRSCGTPAWKSHTQPLPDRSADAARPRRHGVRDIQGHDPVPADGAPPVALVKRLVKARAAELQKGKRMRRRSAPPGVVLGAPDGGRRPRPARRVLDRAGGGP